MARALIKINGVDATAATVTIGSTVLLSNHDEGGELTYAWAIIDQPEGTADSLSNASIESPSLVVTKEGTYEIRLTVNALLGTQAIATAVVSVLDTRTGERIPAGTETTEADGVKGWAKSLNRILARTLKSSTDGNLVIAQTPGSIGPGTIVTLTGLGTINPATQATFTTPKIATALATVEHRERLGVLVDGVTPGNTGANALVLVRMFGLVPFNGTGSPAVGDQVFLSNLGAPALTAGTVARTIGYVIASSGGSYQWVIDSGVGVPDGSITSAKIADGTIATADVGNNQITNAKIAQMGANTIKGNNTAGTANAADLTTAQVRAMLGGNLLARQVLTGSGTYTPTTGTKTIIIELVGAGGGGGGAGGGAGTGIGAGGNSGAYLKSTIALTSGGAFSCGTGGAGGVNTGGTGTTGGDTTIVINGSTITAKGGLGGTGTASGAALMAFPSALSAASSAADITIQNQGNYGLISTGVFWSGVGGGTPMGPGGRGTNDTTANGNAAPSTGFGGGGGGAAATATGRVGGAGANGGIIIYEFS